MIDGQDGLIHTEGVDFTRGQSGGDGRVVVILLECDITLPCRRIECIFVKPGSVDDAVVDHRLNEGHGGSRSGRYADLLAEQVLQFRDAGILLDQDADVVFIVRCGEIPALLSLIGDGESRKYTVDVAGVKKFCSGSRRDGCKFRLNAKVLGDIFGKRDLKSGILAGNGVLEAEALDGILDADSQLAGIDDLLGIRSDHGFRFGTRLGACFGLSGESRHCHGTYRHCACCRHCQHTSC